MTLQLTSPLSTTRRRTSERRGKITDKPILVDVLKKRMPELVTLKLKAKDATDALTVAIKDTAKAANMKPAVVSQFVNARAGDGYEKARAKSGQLELLFVEIGEGSGQGTVPLKM